MASQIDTKLEPASLFLDDDVEQAAADSGIQALFARHYVAAATILLLIAANIVARTVNVDPLAVAQNSRLIFLRPESPHDPLYGPLPINDASHLGILYCGNSQSYAVMDARPGDRSVISWLFTLLNGGSVSASSAYAVRYGSLPNLTLSELTIKTVAAGVDRAHAPDVVIGGIVVDSLRWLDPRAEVAAMARAPAVRLALTEALGVPGQLGRARQLLQASLDPKTDGGATPSGFSAAAIEQAWEDRLDQNIALFGHRKDLYSRFVAEYLTVRNSVLHIDTSTRRPIPEETYRTNLELIELMLAYARRNGIHAVLYMAPVRPLPSNPADPAEVRRFRTDLAGVCAKYGATFLDYTGLLPEAMWTNYPDAIAGNGGQRDYAHFTGRGHERMARQLQIDLAAKLADWLGAKAAPR